MHNSVFRMALVASAFLVGSCGMQPSGTEGSRRSTTKSADKTAATDKSATPSTKDECKSKTVPAGSDTTSQTNA